TQPLLSIFKKNKIEDAFPKNLKNPKEIAPATERPKQASGTGGIKINAPADDRSNISASLHDDEFQRDSFIGEVPVGSGCVQREPPQACRGLSHSNSQLRAPGEGWNRKQTNKEEADDRLGFPRFAGKTLFTSWVSHLNLPLPIVLLRHRV